METKNKKIQIGRICYVVSKVFYCLACVACLVFIVLAATLASTHAIKSLTVGETAVLFGTLAVYAFMMIGLLWNIERVFFHLVKEQTLLSDNVKHYLKKIGIFVILTSTIPAILGTTIVRILTPETELNFPIEFCGIVVGIMLLVLCQFITPDNNLEKND